MKNILIFFFIKFFSTFVHSEYCNDYTCSLKRMTLGRVVTFFTIMFENEKESINLDKFKPFTQAHFHLLPSLHYQLTSWYVRAT